MENQDKAGPSHATGDANQSPTEYGQVSKRFLMKSRNDLYCIKSSIGQGSFGKVYKAFAEISHKSVAIKVFSSINKSGPIREFEMCRIFRGAKNFVQIFDTLEYKERPCLVFEYLEQTLSDFIKTLGPFPIKTVRPLIQQLLEALKVLKDKSIIHADIKPMNIMLNHWTNSGRVIKLIDFGGAMYISQCSRNAVLQTRPYRAPEVLVGAPRNEKIDMWSVGCVVAEMLARRCLYPGKTDRDQLAMITSCQGPLPDRVLLQGLHTYQMYNLVSSDGRDYSFQLGGGALPTAPLAPQAYYTFQTSSLNELIEFDPSASSELKLQMLSLLKLMLHLDSDLRCTPEAALAHTFFSIEPSEAAGSEN